MPVICGMTAALTLELWLRYLVGIKPLLNVRIRRCQLRESQAHKERTCMRGLLRKIITALSSSILLVLPCLRVFRRLFRGTEDATEFSRPLNMTLSDIKS
jgi:hypothetical protein